MKFDTLGLMLDCSRNAVLKPDALKRFIDITSAMGYNTIQLYTEDTYEVEGEPFFGYMRGRYTGKEIQAIDAYCAERGVELIPCIQTLAHFTATKRWGAYSGMFDFDDILLAEDEKTYEFLDNVFASLKKNFTTRRVHIGMDEAHMVGLGKYLDKHGYTNRFEILIKHLERVGRIAEKHGFKAMLMWSDMFFRLANKGEYYSTGNVEQINEIAHLIPKNIELVYWDYYHTERSHYDNMIKAHQKLSDNVWFAGGAWTWTGFTPHNQYSFDITKPAFESCIAHKIKNVFLTMWGDNGAECSFFSILPALMYAAAIARGISSMDRIKKEFKKIVGIAWDDMMLLDLPDSFRNGGFVKNPSKYMLYNDLFNGMFDTTVAGGDKEKYLEFAEKLKKLRKHKEFGYLFESAYRHCEVMHTKLDLGLSTRALYKANDIEGLKALSKNEYALLLKQVKQFYIAFRASWETEKKTSGFDVQDQRFGGLLLRIENCKRRLDEYTSGKTKTIEELETALLDFEKFGNEFSKNPLIFNSWGASVSANIV